MKFFEGITTMQELKKTYKELAMKFHPDRGGDNETMAAINAEYDGVYKAIRAGVKARTGSEKIDLNETDDGFRAVLNVLLSISGLEIELCGLWLWIGGETKEHKGELKAAGCKWAAKKHLWYWKPEWYRRRAHKEYSMEHIREKYGSAHIVSDAADAEKIPA